ncbi:hypothetical protein Salat_1004600 [Sesamum alatum]|uniref:PWWP domain-containing protein n=1 Tax=Sesamum alatum TaxID=300844 RepID=A0AAE2CS21_9LAMI|nr:hypothetical protein Salat_1004600 [Sesamum alatum]
MSDKLGVVDVSSGSSGAASGESNKGVGGGMVDGSESKTLAVNPGDKEILSDGVRVSEESEVLVRESNTGATISGSGLEVAECGSLRINNWHDGGRSRVVGMSRGGGWDSWGVLNLVGRVLEGRLSMDDDEVEDVNNSGNGPVVNLVADSDAWQGVIGEPTSGNGIDIKGTVVDKDSDMGNSGSPGEGAVLNGNQDLISNEMMPGGKFETEEVNDVKDDALIPKRRGEHLITEKEGEYYVSDLVWGKVRSHPWWPGQIFAPSAASDKAIKYFKRESYLIAYFGDQTFAWNEESKIKPFRMHFSQMEKQSNADGFRHAVVCALNEVARRVEFGLSCPCLPRQVHDKLELQEVSNAGIREESSRRAGGDNLSGAASFMPGELVQFVQSLAGCPQSKTDGLQFAVAKAQLLAFNRWKGHYQLPVFEESGLLEDDTSVKGEGKDSVEVVEGILPGSGSGVANDFPSKKRNSTAGDGSSWKRKRLSGVEESSKIKEKHVSALMSEGSTNLQNDEKKPIRRSRRTAISKSGTFAGGASGKSQRAEKIPAEVPSPDVILSNLIVAAKNPLHGHDIMVPVVGLLREFRNSICLEKYSSGNTKGDTGKHKEKQAYNLGTTNTFGFEGTEDSYWTDRIIESDSQEKVLFEPEAPNERAAAVGANTGIALSVDNNKDGDAVIVDLDAENPSIQINEVSDEDFPTALILNFTNLEAIPSIVNLNEIFSRYGPLKESETEIFTKSKRAKVIFKRRADAETAFSSTGKYSIFGPSLVSYRLHYAPPPRKSRAASKRNKKTNI